MNYFLQLTCSEQFSCLFSQDRSLVWILKIIWLQKYPAWGTIQMGIRMGIQGSRRCWHFVMPCDLFTSMCLSNTSHTVVSKEIRIDGWMWNIVCSIQSMVSSSLVSYVVAGHKVLTPYCDGSFGKRFRIQILRFSSNFN